MFGKEGRRPTRRPGRILTVVSPRPNRVEAGAGQGEEGQKAFDPLSCEGGGELPYSPPGTRGEPSLYAMTGRGAVVFQSPRVKSGKFWGMPSSATDFSESGPTEDHMAPS